MHLHQPTHRILVLQQQQQPLLVLQARTSQHLVAFNIIPRHFRCVARRANTGIRIEQLAWRRRIRTAPRHHPVQRGSKLQFGMQPTRHQFIKIGFQCGDRVQDDRGRFLVAQVSPRDHFGQQPLGLVGDLRHPLQVNNLERAIDLVQMCRRSLERVAVLAIPVGQRHARGLQRVIELTLHPCERTQIKFRLSAHGDPS